MYDCLDNDIANICRYEYDYFLNKANVIGVGLGFKEIRGIETCEKVIQVFVERKVPLCNLYKNDQIPLLYKNIKTDVIETGPCRVKETSPDIVGKLIDRVRPVLGGYVIGPAGLGFNGTYGGLVTDGTDNYILSNNHVIAGSNLVPIGNPILQPSPKYGGFSPRDVVANLTKFIPIQFETPTTQPENYVDAAIAKVSGPNLVSPRIKDIGIPKGIIDAKVGMKIQMTAAISGHVTGKIKSIHATSRSQFPTKQIAYFIDQIYFSPDDFGGDSGALVLDKNNNAVALSYAGTDYYSIGNPIELVLNALGVRLVTS